MTEQQHPDEASAATGEGRVRPVDRRRFLTLAGLTTAGAAWAVSGGLQAAQAATGRRAATGATAATAGGYAVPLDSTPHTRTWMAWPDSKAIYGRKLAGMQANIALIANTIADYEPVYLLANAASVSTAKRACTNPNVTVIGSIPIDDCWMRDSGPIFRTNGSGGLNAVGLNFNGWGQKQTHDQDARVARAVAAREELPFTTAAFVGEGGAIETDGDGTVLATESSLVNRNRNRGMSRQQIEAAVLEAYGAQKMLWVPGIKHRDITDDHIDVTSRFIRPGVVMVQLPPADRRDVWARDARAQFDLLSRATDARGRRLEVLRMDGPDSVRSRSSRFVDSYLNFHVVNGAVITAQFGDPVKDAAAERVLAAAFPGRAVVQLDVDRLMAGGGGIHCSTLQQPLA